jgi:osmotically inducible protein OsmC
MATDRTMTTTWHGSLLEGAGTIAPAGSGAFGALEVSWASRAEEPNGKTSPEELIAAAHSTCYSMALANGLSQAGSVPQRLDTKADVTFQAGKGITGIHLSVRANVPGISADDFAKAAQTAKENCPVSQALTGTTITLDAELT